MEHEIRHYEKHKSQKKFSLKKINRWSSVLTVVLLLIISFQLSGANKNLKAIDLRLGSMENFFDNIEQADPTPTQVAPTVEANPTQPSQQPTDMTELIDDDTIKGSEDAPVTIVEFSDFECPFCTRFYRDTLPQIDEQYIKTGKVKLVYRDYPLGFHSNAQKAAEAAECSGEQGKFWEMHDKLFDNGVSGGVASFKQFAEQIGLDKGKFDDCLDSGKMASEVAKDMRDGQSAGIRGTPGFIINGQLVSGAQPFEVFKQVIDSELAK